MPAFPKDVAHKSTRYMLACGIHPAPARACQTPWASPTLAGLKRPQLEAAHRPLQAPL